MNHNKSDSQSLASKLQLRRQILAALSEPLRVLDLYSGAGEIWKALGKEFPIAAYTPVDVKPRLPGCIPLNVDARSVGAFDLARFNVIDLDSYGDCWEVWDTLSRRIQTRTAVFVTYGFQGKGSNWSLSYFLKTASGIPKSWHIPTNEKLLRFLGERFVVNSLTQFSTEKALYFQRPASGFGSAHHTPTDYYGFLISRPGARSQEA
jgi:hypothetical protein